MGPPRAEMTRIEAELRELDRHGDDDDDDDIAMAVVAAAAASALASGQELPASQKALLEAQKMKQMQQAKDSEKNAAMAEFLTPRSRSRRGTGATPRASSGGAGGKAKKAPEKSAADVAKELKIRKMLLAGQLGQTKSKLAAAANDDEREKLQKALASLERDMAELDENIKKTEVGAKVLLDVQKKV